MGEALGAAMGAAVLFGSLGAGCDGRPLAPTGELCHNGIDDDEDGATDCADPDCSASPACVNAVCGDGRAEGQEQCDGADLGGRTCADVVPGSQGTLACGADCRFDPSGCLVVGGCGDGERQPGEQCDCGLDPATLPAGCSAVNGADGGECSAQCRWQAVCGNQVVEPGEECDDGNTVGGDGCSADCQLDDVCTGPGVWDECDPLAPDPCCPDDWGAPLECVSVQSIALCQRGCTDTQDCYFSHDCNPQLGACWLTYCGPGPAALDTYCQVPGGGEGWCTPLFEREDPSADAWGLCVEAGTLPPGAPCEAREDILLDRSEDTCAYGWCVAQQGSPTGRCLQLCDWEAAHDHAVYGEPSPELPCPADTNCLSQAYVDPASGGALQRGVSLCIESSQGGPGMGAYTCSLLTSQLLSDPSQSCGDRFPGGRCQVVDWGTGQRADGTLVGVCAPASAPTRSIGETCDPAVDVCPSGSSCVHEDELDPNPAAPTRCVPWCDAARDVDPGDCAARGASADARCVSVSARHGVPASSDQSRLGLCLPP